MVRFVFAELLGIRMCFRCPNCSCRDALGQSTHPMGGILGLVLGFCGAIEYQKNSNPHFHANVYVATVWQQPLKKLAQKIQATAITLEELFRYQAWLHNESHFNLEQHEALFPALEKSGCKTSLGRSMTGYAFGQLLLPQTPRLRRGCHGLPTAGHSA